MLETPSISVVIANYNGQRYLGSCLASLDELSYPSDLLEIILVDNASTDGSVDYVKSSFPRVLNIRNPRNLGFGAANNLGAKQARGECLAFLNNDMRVDKNWLRRLVEALDPQRKMVCVGAKILSWNGRKVDFGGAAMNFHGYGFQLGRGSKHVDSPSEIEPILFPCGGATLIQRDAFSKVGGFAEDYFAFYEDTDLGWRLWLSGYEVRYAPRALVYHLQHQTASRLSPSEHIHLYSRNALYNVLRNYSDAYLERILPVAILLLVKRAMLTMGYEGVHTKGTRVKDHQEKAHAALLERLSVSLTKDGLVSTFGKVWGGLKVLLGGSPRSLQLTPLPLSRWSKHPELGASQLQALNEFIDRFPELLEQRERIQAARERRDEEIVSLFRLPFEPAWLHPSYVKAQEELVAASGIKELFEVGEES